MKITVLIITYNNEKTINKLIQSINTYIGSSVCEILVLDNSQNLETVKVISMLQDNKVKLIHNDLNFGYRRALNMGVKISSNEIILVLNPDVELLDGCIEKCVDYVYKHEDAAYCFPNSTDVETYGINAGGNFGVPFLSYSLVKKDRIDGDEFYNVDIGGGAVFVIKKSIYIKAGGLDESIFMYDEEEELAYKFANLGKRIVAHTSCKVFHEGGHSTKSYENYNHLIYTWLEAKKFLYKKYVHDDKLHKLIWMILFLFIVIEYSFFFKTKSFFKVIFNSRDVKPSGFTGIFFPKWNLVSFFVNTLVTIKRLKKKYGGYHFRR